MAALLPKHPLPSFGEWREALFSILQMDDWPRTWKHLITGVQAGVKTKKKQDHMPERLTIHICERKVFFSPPAVQRFDIYSETSIFLSLSNKDGVKDQAFLLWTASPPKIDSSPAVHPAHPPSPLRADSTRRISWKGSSTSRRVSF